ncbi:hypothetical protein GCM10023331_27850 [Algivirga pacifica]|uniref:Agmatine deiminase n=1 Tax=Algivirga pacifica TaxID=1162670 RepID=A0ABP9DEY0_9BACT
MGETFSSPYDTLEAKQSICEKQGIAMTDIYKCIERTANGCEDKHLQVIEWNDEGIQACLTKNLKRIFFTSEYVRKHFEKRFSHIDLELLTLPSPAPTASRGIGRNTTYKEMKANNTIENTYEYRLTKYKEAFNVPSNQLYFSELLETDPKYKNSFENIQKALHKHGIEYQLLKETKDIWCRDYMPVEASNGTLVQFRYDPSYLQGYDTLKTNPETVLSAHQIDALRSTLNVDGGNIILRGNKAILTNRVLKENPDLSEKDIKDQLSKILKADIYFIPAITEDMTGHADGHLRFIDDETILINKLEGEFKYVREGMEKMLKESGLKAIEIPWFEYDAPKNKKDHAIGVYVNYLELDNLILFPIFEVEGNEDQKAYEIIKQVFPNKKIEMVNINEIALEGGLMNCISWTRRN